MPKKIIKNHNNRNRYCLTKTGLWVRDFTKSAHPQDINNLISKKDYGLMLQNELANATMNIANIDVEPVYAPNLVIVSDGYKFKEKLHLLKNLLQEKVTILGVNRSLCKWDSSRRMDWFLVNNPYDECVGFIPKQNYYPRCIVSSRTSPLFVQKYKSRRGVLYKYIPVCDKNFSSNYSMSPIYYIDDYRNPICAAISLAARWGTQKLLLFCCDDVFEDERPGAEKLPNGLWMYPQQNISHGLIEGCLHWLSDVKIGNHSAGPEYDNAIYINEEGITGFFE